jgi:cytochrome c nitrite reductase small subunit
MTKLPLIIAIAFTLMVVGYFAFVTNAPAYAGSDPETCNNCHAMDSQYENWYHAPHEKWTKCVDCHLPHDNIAIYYMEKGRQGMKDVLAFTMGNIPVAIRASDKTKTIIQENCLRCHNSTVESITMGAQPFDRYCWDCHRTVAHGPRGISLVPYQDSNLYPAK